MTITTNAPDRKEMAHEIAAHLGLPSVYMRAPTYAFKIGGLTVERDGCISADDPADLEAIRPFLIEHGYIEDTPQTTVEEETVTPDIGPGGISITVGFPCENDTVDTIRNLVFMLSSKQHLLNKASGNETILVTEAAVSELQEHLPESMDALEVMLDELTRGDDLSGFNLKEGGIFIDFGPVDDNDIYNAFFCLTQKMIETARTATRVAPAPLEPESEKYTMRAWLVRLGMGSAEYKDIRKTLMKRLSGHSAFPNSEAAQKHKEKYGTSRKAVQNDD